jgi:hypothetical protein
MGADIDSDQNLPVAKFRTRLKKILRFQKNRPTWDFVKLYAQRQRVQETLEENFCTTHLTWIEQGSNPGLHGDRPPKAYTFSSHREYRQSVSAISAIWFTVTK